MSSSAGFSSVIAAVVYMAAKPKIDAVVAMSGTGEHTQG